jgi:hypothetical protein
VHTLPDDVSVQTNLAEQPTDFSPPPQTPLTATAAPLPTLSEIAQQGENDQINLDYLYIEPDNNNTSLMEHASEFDRIQFQQLAQGFDPLISSWVQEYFGETVSPQHRSPAMDMDGLSLGS